ncbi:alpha/beta fold hydrolase [Mangrovivirga sp. M17]|uniref:Alpha/beta fold hydrolase n=1 Tax=Mangrovivirga halotolerans TaxID=2993936 RepID=A0ABT3RTC6_9BACT|nr:S9 family peptidase [Mangrovivirga halotolerans]MCX2744502.1 alpha/beta fold hydrolase [Mangrovivirga halotolerans]
MKQRFIAVLFFISFIALNAQERYSDLRDALYNAGKLSGQSGPASVNWINEGEQFSFMDGNIIKQYDPSTGSESVIFDPSGKTFPNTATEFTYNSFQWSKDSKFILFKTNFRPVWRRSGISDYFLYSLEEESFKLVAKDAQTAELSPDGSKVGYERGGNLFVYDLSAEKETQLTNDAEDQFYNGRFGWAYEEEFGLAQAWSWSPDSKNIAFWQSDEREVPVFRMTDYQNVGHNDYVKIRYPKVGDTNPKVRIGVIDISSGSKEWMKIPMNDDYIPRIYWTADDSKLAIVHMNRKQNHLKLFMSDIKSGDSKVVFEEKSDAWIDVFDFFAGIDHLFFFPEDTEEFFWISDRDGYSHIYRYDYNGELINQVTDGNWEVVFVHEVNPKSKTIYYSSTEESPLERHLYSIKFNGKKKTKMTSEPGRHKIDFSPSSEMYLDYYSNVNTPRQVILKDVKKNNTVKHFVDNESVKEYVKEHVYSQKELFSFTSDDGTKLDGYIIKPVDFDETKQYPLVLNIYGGPGAQSVYNDFATNGWEQYLAQEGYVIVSVNNRGSGGYGSAFEKIVYEDLGNYESKDFVSTVKYLSEIHDWIDGENMAIRGHSYGGYMSSMTMLRHPGIFKVSLVGAPVTDWRLYDSIYAERYMGLIDGNDEKWFNASPQSYAGNLDGHMFIAHSTMDENVHVQNTFQLVKKLIDNGKDADLRIYPPGAHGVAYSGPSYVLLYQQYVDYLNKYLRSNKQNLN